MPRETGLGKRRIQMNRIYVVMGSTGEYSDRDEWPVLAYTNERAAQNHVAKATERADELYSKYHDYYDIPVNSNEYDPDMEIDYTGTRYFIYRTELVQEDQGDNNVDRRRCGDGPAGSRWQRRTLGQRHARDLTQEFERLARLWKKETCHLSSMQQIVLHPAYQKIIGMGERVLCMLLEKMRSCPDHWGWALTAITGEDPVSEEDVGRVDRIAAAWAEWGKDRGYL
jgi:hypothetical protein